MEVVRRLVGEGLELELLLELLLLLLLLFRLGIVLDVTWPFSVRVRF